MDIRSAEASDLAGILKVHRSIFPKSLDPALGYEYAIKNNIVLVADEGEVVGYGILRRALLDELYILEEHRGGGISSGMLKKFEKRAREQGIKTLKRHAHSPAPADFKRLLAFYKKYGYKELQINFAGNPWADLEKEL